MTYRWHTLSFWTMNTAAAIWLYSDERGEPVLEAAQQFFRAVERRMSRFDRTSELSRLNNAAGSAVPVSDALYEVVELALAAAEASSGLFDPTLLNTMEEAGYDRSFDELVAGGHAPPRPTGGDGAFLGGGFRQMRIWRSKPNPMVYLPKGVRLDLGGIAKGWAVDRVVDKMEGLGPCLVNAGGDLYAHGSPPGDWAWTVGVEDPLDEDRNIATLAVRDRAVATSSRTKRRWVRGEQRQHHLMDPRHGRPSQSDLLSVTIVAQRAAIAEIYAKVVFLLGSAAGLNYLERQPRVAGLLVTEDGKILLTSTMEPYMLVPEQSDVCTQGKKMSHG
ncbi:MAG: FAD:protein FMN transferase [Chloroflexi bacterium]|nr:FAD:protein FMN transferase [Chloroflexota bacterium]